MRIEPDAGGAPGAEGADGEQDGGVNIEAPSANLMLTGHAPTVVVETAEDIDKAARRRFSKEPAAAVTEAERARDIARSLQIFLTDMRLNNPEVQQAEELLTRQINALDSIIAILQSGGDSKAAQKSYRDQLIDVLEGFLERLKEENVTRALVATIALSVLSIAGVQVHAIAGALVAGHAIGIDNEILKTILTGLKGKK